MSRIFPLALTLLVALPSTSEARPKRPVLAVFDMEARFVKLSPAKLRALSDVLAVSLAEGSAYQLVPRSQIKRRLAAQRTRSYRDCHDQSCQIELGRELAASKSLAAQVVALGRRCMVTAVIYDLRSATSERGATAHSGCSESELLAAVQRVARQLLGKEAPRATPSGAAGSDSAIAEELRARQERYLRICRVIRSMGRSIDNLHKREAARVIQKQIPGFVARDFTQIALRYRVVRCYDPHLKSYDNCTLGALLRYRPHGRCR